MAHFEKIHIPTICAKLDHSQVHKWRKQLKGNTHPHIYNNSIYDFEIINTMWPRNEMANFTIKSGKETLEKFEALKE